MEKMLHVLTSLKNKNVSSMTHMHHNEETPHLKFSLIIIKPFRHETP